MRHDRQEEGRTKTADEQGSVKGLTTYLQTLADVWKAIEDVGGITITHEWFVDLIGKIRKLEALAAEKDSRLQILREQVEKTINQLAADLGNIKAPAVSRSKKEILEQTIAELKSSLSKTDGQEAEATK